ncbi:ferritin-like domain-containing protein [Wolbachia endosymbiont of Litomosoides sigmodontis]|uniref:ferritin-like domain-containing protein n=1 Tax=Wolbachia endosymbiont of Litomosoides sigmodontis TaxID=80850 RepID=UPI001FE829C6|nr:ferritin-like domain-containing protein [Wolbachia endosymbiont of Litomosoides sigmodontis]
MKNKLNEKLEHENKQIERILLLKGIPNFQDTNEILKYKEKFIKDIIRKILERDLKLEEIKNYNKAISIPEKEKDFVSATY